MPIATNYYETKVPEWRSNIDRQTALDVQDYVNQFLPHREGEIIARQARQTAQQAPQGRGVHEQRFLQYVERRRINGHPFSIDEYERGLKRAYERDAAEANLPPRQPQQATEQQAPGRSSEFQIFPGSRLSQFLNAYGQAERDGERLPFGPRGTAAFNAEYTRLRNLDIEQPLPEAAAYERRRQEMRGEQPGPASRQEETKEREEKYGAEARNIPKPAQPQVGPAPRAPLSSLSEFHRLPETERIRMFGLPTSEGYLNEYRRLLELDRQRKPGAAPQANQQAPVPPQQQAAPAPNPADVAAYEEAKLRREKAQQQLAAADAAAAAGFATRPVNGRSANQVFNEDQAGSRGLHRYVPDPNLVRAANAPLPPMPGAALATSQAAQPPQAVQKTGAAPSAQQAGQEAENRRFQAAAQRMFNMPEPSRHAPLPPSILSAMEMMENPDERGAYRANLKDAQEAANIAMRSFPENRATYMNPYTNDVVNRIRTEGMKTFNRDIMPALEAKFVRQGAHGGSRHATLAQRAADDVQQRILEQQGKALHAGFGQAGELYNADQARRLQAAQQLQNLAGRQQAGHLAEVEGLGAVGRQEMGHAQQGKDIGYQQFLRERYEPLDLLAQQAAIMQGMPAPQMGAAYQHTPANPQLNTAANLGSLATQLLGARMGMSRKSGGHITGRR